VTAVFEVLTTVAVNEVCCEALNVAVAGVTVTVTVLLVLEFPPPHPARKILEMINSSAAVETGARKIRRRNTRHRFRQLPAKPLKDLFV
jgi:hypothetical protein